MMDAINLDKKLKDFELAAYQQGVVFVRSGNNQFRNADSQPRLDRMKQDILSAYEAQSARIAELEAEVEELKHASGDLLRVVEEHGNPIMKAHATIINRVRKAIGYCPGGQPQGLVPMRGQVNDGTQKEKPPPTADDRCVPHFGGTLFYHRAGDGIGEPGSRKAG